MLFDYPTKARFGRKIPKSKLYENASANTKLKDKFVNQIEKIVWQYKLAPNTLNLDATNKVPEIQVFDIFLKTKEVDQVLLEVIDKAIPLPIIFQIHKGNKVKIKAAYKRPSESANNKWVIESYFESEWLDKGIAKQPMPQVLDLGKLYEQLLKSLMQLGFSNYETKTRLVFAANLDAINIEKLTLKAASIKNTTDKAISVNVTFQKKCPGCPRLREKYDKSFSVAPQKDLTVKDEPNIIFDMKLDDSTRHLILDARERGKLAVFSVKPQPERTFPRHVDFDEVYKKVDAILTPSTPSSAFKIGEKKDDPVSMYLNDIFTVPVNLAGLPAISIPAGHDAAGYPLGLQIIGKAFKEQEILNLAYAMEDKINFKNKISDWWIK